jgi:hypothetical protein
MAPPTCGHPLRKLCLLLSPVLILAGYAAILAVPKTRTLGLRALYENGPVEWATFAFLLAAAVLGARLARRCWKRREGIIVCAFLTLYSAGVFLVAMEEIAWGQRVFAFETPAAIKAHNRQGELTIHNLDGLHQSLHHLNAAFGIGGLIGVALGSSRLLGRVAAPRVLVLWFLTEALLGTAAIHVDTFTFNEQFARCVRRLSELNELLIAISALLYVWLVAERFRGGWTSAPRASILSPR